MVCQTITQFGIDGLGDFLVYPITCDYYFYAKLFAGLFIIFTGLLFYAEKKSGLLKPDLISSAGVASLVILFLATIGTLITSTTGIPMVQSDILGYIIAFTIVFVGLWFVKRT